MVAENTLLVLLLVLGIGLLIPEVFKKFRVPLITLIILAGAITGPYGLNYVQMDDTITVFLASWAWLSLCSLLAWRLTSQSSLSQNTRLLLWRCLTGWFPLV